MAKLGKSGFHFIGTIQGLTAYTRRGSDQVIIRSAGGPTKKQIKKAPAFQRTRENNAEFGGTATTSSGLLLTVAELRPLADFNLMPRFNKLLRNILLLDTDAPRGQRGIYLSKDPGILTGFDFNEKNTFSSIIRRAIPYTIDKTTGEATVDITALVPGINFFVPGKYPFYSIVVTLGVMMDTVYTERRYEPIDAMYMSWRSVVETAWWPTGVKAEETTLTIKLKKPPPAANATIILGIGIKFGMPGLGGVPEQIRYAGAAKVLEAK